MAQQHRHIAVGTPLGEDVLLLTHFSYTETLSELFEMELDLISKKNDIKFDDIVGHNVTVRLDLAGDESRYFNGYVSRFSQVGQDNGLAQYRATVSPWLWFHTQIADCRIFQNKTTPVIIKEVLGKAGDIKEDLQGEPRQWEYCVQYRETNFNFVSRLMEQEGIYYYWKHEDGKHTMVLTNDSATHEPYPEYDQIPYYPPTQQTREKEYIFEWSIEKEIQPRVYTHTDYNFTNSRADLTASRKIERQDGALDFEVFDYPGEYSDTGEGEDYARIRIEEIQAEYETLRGETTARGISAGFKFGLTNHPRKDQLREYLVTNMSLSASNPDYSSGEGGAEDFNCSFAAIDATQSYRSPRKTPKPIVQGPQTAMVVGPSGEEIHTDKYGRIKVQFHWDRYSKTDENSSCWIRVAQHWAGKGWGAFFLPRIGQEVIVEFLEGDPDRPIITGEVYNDEATTPYTLPGDKTISTIKSNSSTGGGGFNEIRLEDNAGSEQIFIHAEKDMDVRVKNDSREWIGNERHVIVIGNQFEKVQGDNHLVVEKNQNEWIQGDHSLIVDGGQFVKIEGENHLSTGSQFQDISGDQNLNVASNLNAEAGQKISIKAGMDFHEAAGMNYAMEAGMEVHIKGGMKVVIEGGLQVSLKAGPSFVDIGPSGVSISGPLVNINSGGAAAAGSGSAPDPPASPENPDTPEEPTEAATGEPGEVCEPPITPEPPTPVTFCPHSTTIMQAAKDGTPFCEECEKAKKQQQAGN